jgi:hypothetical protein
VDNFGKSENVHKKIKGYIKKFVEIIGNAENFHRNK